MCRRVAKLIGLPSQDLGDRGIEFESDLMDDAMAVMKMKLMIW
jgi:hypothetical protein